MRSIKSSLLLTTLLLISCATSDVNLAIAKGGDSSRTEKSESSDKKKSKSDKDSKKSKNEKSDKKSSKDDKGTTADKGTTTDKPDQQQVIGDSAVRLLGAFSPIPAEKERAIGGSVAVKSFSTQGRLYANDEVQAYVNKVGLALVRQSSRKGQPFSFAVVDTADVASWAAPGGYVFVSRGLLERVEDESELAGVLAHEIAHVTQQHMVKMMKRSQGISSVLSATQGLTQEDVTQYAQAADLGEDLLFNRGLDRNMEYEADLAGVELAALTGYDPKGLPRFLERLQKSGIGRDNKILSTHPDLADRVNRIDYKLKTEMPGVEGAVQKERFQKIVGQALKPS